MISYLIINQTIVISKLMMSPFRMGVFQIANLWVRVLSKVCDFNNMNIYLTAKLLKQGYQYHHFLNRPLSHYRILPVSRDIG